jgi:hypothetical protein
MNKAFLTRGALLGAACAMLTIGSASAQTYPPGTNCQSLLGGLRTACLNQARSMNSANGVIPNSAGSNTVIPGTNGLNNGLNTGTTMTPNTVAPNTVTPNGTVSPNAVVPNGTVSPNAVVPNGTVNPNAVGMPNTTAPTGNQVITPPAGSGTNGIGTNGTGTGAGGTGTTGGSMGTSGN